jgi:GT2 family glycosyltransferase
MVEISRLPENVGTSAAKNAAAALVESDYLLFVDSDVVLRPEWLEYGIAFMENSNAGMVAGKIVPVTGSSLLRRWRLQFLETNVHRSGLSEPESENWLNGHALLVRRAVFDDVGGFDPRFRSCGDDPDLSQRIVTSGRPLFFLPQLVAECHEPASLEYLARKSVRNLGWDLRPKDSPPCACVRPLRLVAASASVLWSLVEHLGRNLLKGRLSLLPVDVAVAWRSLQLVWGARGR